MNLERFQRSYPWRVGLPLVAVFLSASMVVAGQHERSVFVLTSTKNASSNAVVVFTLDTEGTPSLSLTGTLPTGGKGGASTNAGILQFGDDLGAVANYGSNSVSQLIRSGDFIAIGKTINLAPDRGNPSSFALTKELFVGVGANCAEPHAWPAGTLDGTIVPLSDPSAAQIAVGENWAAVTLASGSVLQLPLTQDDGVLNGTSATVTLPSDANSVPLGASFWGNILGFTPAHRPDTALSL